MVNQSVIRSVKEGDERAFRQLYQSFIRYVFSIVSRYVTNKSDHQDVIQEIFARVYLSIKTYDESKGEFKYWLRRITINQCIQHSRKKANYGKTISIESITEAPLVWEKVNTLSRKELLLYLKKMPEGYKQVFMLIVIDEYSHQEVGKMLAISPETSRSQLHRAKKWLNRNLSKDSLKLLAG